MTILSSKPPSRTRDGVRQARTRCVPPVPGCKPLDKLAGVWRATACAYLATHMMLTSVRSRSAPMSDPVARLNAALQGRYTIER